MAQADWSAPEAAAAVQHAADAALAYLKTLPDRPVGATATHAELIGRVPASLPTGGLPAPDVVAELLARDRGRHRRHRLAPLPRLRHRRRAAGHRGGRLARRPPGTRTPGSSPAARPRRCSSRSPRRWVLEALHLPSTASVAMVTGCQMAHVTCLAAARHRVLADQGWDVERDGLVGAPAHPGADR